ncbi:MAG TPA: GAF domain-containing protein, partial [Thiotrichales bacterium]|nr:GAF domain-containing protein [Thiotrichales bacterium]
MARLQHPHSHAERVMLVGAHGASKSMDVPHEVISTSWQRCINDFGLDPADKPESEIIEASSLKARRDEMHDFINVARGECRNLYEQISQSGYTIALTDAEGVILEQLTDSGLEKAFKQCGLLPGSVWSEKRRGTNGMGTALQVSNPVIVHREDHFYDTDLGLTCTSSPIFDPHGKIAGVLDVSAFDMGGSWQSQIHTRALVQMAANFIEYHYFQQLYQDHTLLRFHPRSEFLGVGTEALMALDDDGTILAVNDKTLGQLGYEDRNRILGRHINDVFSLKEEMLDTRFSQLGHRVFPVEDIHHGRRYLAPILKED